MGLYAYHLEIGTDWELVGSLKELVDLPKFFSLKDYIKNIPLTVENLAIALISFSHAAFDVVSGRLP